MQNEKCKIDRRSFCILHFAFLHAPPRSPSSRSLDWPCTLFPMRAMLLREPRQRLELVEVPKPAPSRGQIVIRVTACAVCRTDLHIVDGELRHPKLPLIPGHQIVGINEDNGERVG